MELCQGFPAALSCPQLQRATQLDAQHPEEVKMEPRRLSRPCPSPGQKPRVSENDFEDLLSNQGFSSKADKRGPRTMAEMRRQDQARGTDPLRLKV